MNTKKHNNKLKNNSYENIKKLFLNKSLKNMKKNDNIKNREYWILIVFKKAIVIYTMVESKV